ncbi:MAG TPA: 3-deoxy-7-phosphoheptulonate synthase [Phycisphaerae bacterium]|nr:3-deoxy-7-phosphoheptulonate synthase [Phycisphaerae bacterium]
MIVILKSGASEEVVQHVAERITQLGLTPHISRGEFRTIIGAIGEEGVALPEQLEQIAGVEKVMPIMRPYKLASREFHPDDTALEIRGVKIGGDYCAVIAGPCSVENRELLLNVARQVKAAGASILRGGAFKPRTSPYSFQGLGKEGLEYLAQARAELDMPVITEVMDPRDVELMTDYTDIYQIGARNMQNYNLLLEVGQTNKPVFLKRGMAAPINELLMSAEYVMSRGNHQVILCERGIRTFETQTRFTLDISAVPVIRANSHLPIFVDPSHAAGKRELVADLALAGMAAGAHGVMVEVHTDPEQALSDGPQSMLPSGFRRLMERLRQVAEVLGRRLN